MPSVCVCVCARTEEWVLIKALLSVQAAWLCQASVVLVHLMENSVLSFKWMTVCVSASVCSRYTTV